MQNEDSVGDVLVVWCATTDLNETSIVGWYKNATVYRLYQSCEFDTGYIQYYNIIAKKEDCVLLPRDERHCHKWDVPVAKKRSFGFGQSMIWYATEEKAENYIRGLKEHIDQYCDENWIDKSED